MKVASIVNFEKRMMIMMLEAEKKINLNGGNSTIGPNCRLKMMR